MGENPCEKVQVPFGVLKRHRSTPDVSKKVLRKSSGEKKTEKKSGGNKKSRIPDLGEESGKSEIV